MSAPKDPAAASYARPMAGDLETELDRLYDLPPAGFVAARDALAKELKGADRDAVKALRRPSVVAALANRLARDEPQALQDLLAAGEQLREAQVRGSGDVRAAVAGQRQAVDALVQAARKQGATGANVDRLRTLLKAAAGDDELRAAFERGRIEREPEAGGSWPALTLTGGSAPPGAKPAASKKGTETTRDGRGSGAAAKAAARKQSDKTTARSRSDKAAAREQARADARRKAQVERHKRLVAQADERRRERERDVAAAEKDAGRAQTRLERATAASAKAREALAAAEEREAEAREDAQRALRALKAAQAHLQEVQDDVAAVRTAS